MLWLEDWLKSYQGTLLMISHDRDFLDAVADHTLNLDQQHLKLYSGGYSDFERQRSAHLWIRGERNDRREHHQDHSP